MSLITRCPACGTMFKVVSDQLRISEGWVRCGQCSEIFDATASLQGPQASAAPGQGMAGAPSAPSDLPATPAPFFPAEVPARIEMAQPLAAPLQPAAVPAAFPPAPEAPDSIDPPPLYPSFPSEIHDSQLQREASQEEPDLDDVPFVRSARRKAFWRRPLVRALLLLLLLLLAGLLALQYVAHDHDRLAALRPALRPWLQLLCEPLKCRVEAPRQIDAIVIDTSSFSKLRSDAYRLSFTLKNQAPIEVAMPSVELTLTDTQDQPVIRRVLAPSDVGAAAAIPAASESNTTIALSVAPYGGSPRIAGYRLLAFYP